MKKANWFETHGTTTKTEYLNPVKHKILENTFVAEGRKPYSDYYGLIPKVMKPHSLFMFTKQFYPLNEVLTAVKDAALCPTYSNKIDVATSILDFTDHYHYALRIKHFPDYGKIDDLQSCFVSEGFKFIKKVHLPEAVSVTVFKRFHLAKFEEGIYLDQDNGNKAYVIIPRQIDTDEFSEMLINLRNNNDCPLFDAALGTLKIKTNTVNMIRIYSENINQQLLMCAKQKFSLYASRQVFEAY